jgi:hypothetical protein
MNLVAKYQLGGAALWTLGMEDPTATTAMRNVALAIAPDPVTNILTTENTDNEQINFGDIFTLKGALTLNDKSPIVGLAVNIEMKRANESAWTKITESITSADGTISMPVTIGGTAAFRLTTAGTWQRAASVSNEALVTVRAKVILARPATVQHGDLIQIRGAVLPQIVGATATLQKLTAGKWQNIGVGASTGAKGDFLLSTTELSRGVVTMRVQIATGSQPINSPEFSIVVR